MSNTDERKEPRWVSFVTGGLASCTAELVTLPIDTCKVRLQVQTTREYSGMLDVLRKVPKQEGVFALWKGLSPALLRQSSYSGIRMGIYEPIRNVIAGVDNKDISYVQKLLAGGTSGGIGIALANPTEVVKIRMQSDKAGTRYSGTLSAFADIVKREGVLGLWTGVGPNVQRAFIVNAAELGTYDHAKGILIESGVFAPDSSLTHFAASFIAGFFAAVASSPVDVIKNRLMSQDSSKKVYTGMLDCAAKTVQKEGVLALWNGLLPNWLRLGPWCVVMFMSYEQYRLYAQRVWK